MADFKPAYTFVRHWEGGNDDDPQDPGGRTSRGILQREYTAYLKSKGLRNKDVWKASEAEIEDIYLKQYWAFVRGDELVSDALAMCLFDAGVLNGVNGAIRWAQTSFNSLNLQEKLKVDSKIGIITLQALNSLSRERKIQFINIFLDMRLNYMRKLPIAGRFYAGWKNRVTDLRQKAISAT